MKTIITWTAVITMAFATLAFAGIPQTINYQGYLKDGSGSPLSTPVTLTFRLYQTAEGSTAVWSESVNVTPKEGIYSLILGTFTPLASSLFNNVLYLGVQVDSGAELPGRQLISSVPFAFRSEVAESVTFNSVDTDALFDGVVTTPKLADGAVTAQKIAAGSITANELASNAVTSQSIAWHSITPDRLDTTFVKTSGDSMSGPLLLVSGSAATAMDVRATNNASTAEAVKITNSGTGTAFSSYAGSTGGSAGLFSIVASLNNADALTATTPGGGNAGTFTIFNAASTGSALHASTNGAGDAIQAVNSGSGLAGHFLGDVTITGLLTPNALSAASIDTQALQDGAVTSAKIGAPVSSAKGGTGIDTSTTASGSLLYTSATGTWNALTSGTNGQVLKMTAGVPAWGADTTNSGTVTSITAGTGLTGGTISGSGTIAIDAAAVAQLGSLNTFARAQTIQNGGAASAVPLTIQGVSGQSANLQEWQDSSGHPVAALSPAGDISVDGNLKLPTPNSTTGIIYAGTYKLLHSFSGNMYVGLDAGKATTSGLSNSACGIGALELVTTGSYNTAVGHYAGVENVGGDGNTFLGAGADAFTNMSSLTNATAIGYNAIVNASNKVRIGNTAVTVIEGQVAMTTTSDIRQKKDIASLSHGLEFIKQLRPVEYRMKLGNGRKDFGFIAQDIETVLGADYNVLGVGEDADRSLTLRYTDFIAPLVKAVQEQQTTIEQLRAELAEIRKLLGRQ